MKKLFLLLLFCTSVYAQNQKPIVAIFHLDRFYTEGHQEPGLEEIFNKEQVPTTFLSLTQRLQKAANDPNVKACLFYGEFSGLGLAQTEELCRLMKLLKTKGKDTIYFATNLSNLNMVAATAVEKLYLFPQGEVIFNGMSFQNMYFKGLLDKLGLEADVIHIGDFKSAGEPFYLTQPSKESAAQSKKLFDEIYANTIKQIAQNKNLKEAEVKQLTEIGIFSSEEAKSKKLVSDLSLHKDLASTIRSGYGNDLVITSKYGVQKTEKLKMNSIMDLFVLIQKLSAPPVRDMSKKISVTTLEGPITNFNGEPLRKHILKQTKDRTVKAMVLRVNSPGGSAQVSEAIYQALLEFKKAGKPLIISMGNIAASGGYYIAAPGDHIFAENSTITGSIGVVGGKVVFKQMLDKLGISTHQYNIGQFSNIMSPTQKFSDTEKHLIKKSFSRVYDTFKERVESGRKGKLTEELEAIAGGRVYTGSQALNLGLIDQIGGLTEAIQLAAKNSNISNFKLSVYPKKVDIMDLLSKELRQDEDNTFIQSDNSSLSNLFTHSLIKSQIKSLHSLNPMLAKQLSSFLQQLQLFANEGVLLVSPQYPY
ncbi:MAG: signal peptide peptidase SppA [Lentisphaerales bacterium]|nr:signal peptide peptidase SppA [Lentisphaerales bacterium]